VTTILTHHKSWRAAPLARVRAPDLSPEEMANVRAALRFLRTRLGGTKLLAAALGMSATALSIAMSKNRRPSASLAIRAARVARQPVDDLLYGALPSKTACPHCGRG
jgi:hypothetical protein